MKSDIQTMLRAVVHAAIDTGAACQKAKSFVAAEPGRPLRSVYDVKFDQAINALRDTLVADRDTRRQAMDELVRISQSAGFYDPPGSEGMRKIINDQAALLREVLRDGLLPQVLRQKVWTAVNG